MKFVKLDTIKNTLLVFSNIFGDISIPVYNNDGEIIDTTVIPILYGSRNKTYEILNSKYLATDLNPDNKIELAHKLPVLSVSEISVNQDPSRQRNRTQRMTEFGNDSYMAVPMTLNFSLNLRTKTQDDLFCVIEQIAPYFTPSLNINIKTTKQNNFSESIQFNLEGVTTQIPVDVDVNEVIYYEATFTFLCKLHFYRLPLTSEPGEEKIGISGSKKDMINNIIVDVKIEDKT